MWEFVDNGARVKLYSPTAMPRACGFLWNKQMMIQMNCRGYAVAQFMQPEPAKYAYAPNLEAKTFMQPEQPYYAHHPGRFFYIKDHETGELFSAPYEPVRQATESFCFSADKSELSWTVRHKQIEITLALSLPKDDVVELWSVSVKNVGHQNKKISLYPYFTIGYMSWMNQSARYDEALGAVVAKCVTPYQKVEDYFKNKNFKDQTFLLHDTKPDAFETSRERFEGEGGLHNPSAIQQTTLENGDALYETPIAVLQYNLELTPGSQKDMRFLFGPAFDEQEVAQKRLTYFESAQFESERSRYRQYVEEGSGVLNIETPDKHLDAFVNHWLPRQVFYHGDVNRLTTDPQTRNYLQDNMGMTYINPQVTREAFLHALSQQESSGAMPDGILLLENAELKYINQIPHTDHCVWLPVCLKAYLDETNDYDLLNEWVVAKDDKSKKTVFERICNAMDWLLEARDERGLSYIAQGDWCDPMNMVGYKGKGVSGWLSLAAAYALNLWSNICDSRQDSAHAKKFAAGAEEINTAVKEHLWDGNWFGRGITDDNVAFGTAKDAEGKIFLNPQSWAILSGAADDQRREQMIAAIESQLETPYGVMMLAPAFTAMRDDVGRVTQKFPGSAENGSVYNHAAVFYIFSLFQCGEGDRAFKLLRSMIAGPDETDLRQRGQLPIFIPNYYRGAYYQHPRTAGRSSQLFNTGTVSWVYRCLVEGLFGLKGCSEGLTINPQMPADWANMKTIRQFRGATLTVQYERREQSQRMEISVDGETLEGTVLTNIQPNKHYDIKVWLAK